jgi:hypothetical protein
MENRPGSFTSSQIHELLRKEARTPPAILRLGSNEANCGANKDFPIVLIERDNTEKKTFQYIERW